MATNEQQDQSRAAQLEEAMTKRLRQQRNPFLKPIFAVAAIGTLFMIFALIMQMMADAEKEPAAAPPAEETHLTVHGDCVCICCTLRLSTQHHRAIRYQSGGNQQRVVLLQDNPGKDMNLDYFCGGPTPVLVEGDLIETNGLQILQAQAFKAFPAAPPQIP